MYSWNNGQTGTTCISNLPVGNYCVTITDALGCTASCCALVTQPPLLTVNCYVIDSISCYGLCDGSASVTAQGGTPPYWYMWSNGATGTPIDFMCPGTYCVTVVDANGCAADCCVTLSEPPELVVDLGSDTVLCDTLDLDLCAMGNFVSWLWSTTETTSCITINTTGTYTVTVTDADGCQASDAIDVLFDTCTGIEEYSANFRIYPNPTTGQVHIVFPPGMAKARLNVYDITGRLLIVNELLYAQILDVSSLRGGVYLLEIDGSFRVRLFVE
jgi:hypothetical protein